MYVNCGKCNCCLSAYKSAWTTRLDNEVKSSAYSLFFTLTYDNAHIPTLTLSNNVLHSNRTSDDDIILCDYGINNPYLPKIQNYESDTETIGYCSKSDVQKFFKRLRRKVEYDQKKIITNIPKHFREFRYFVTAEYGPNTYRPHYHGLLFFSNEHVGRAVEKHYLHQSWQLCDSKNIDVSRVINNASTYVAKYVRGSLNTPAILSVPSKTKVFYLSSRRPAIGIPYFNYLELSNKIKQHEAETTVHRTIDNVPTTQSLPLPSSVAKFYFPKLYKSYSYDYAQLCNHYTNCYQYINQAELTTIFDSCDTYRDQYTAISSLLPNHVPYVNEKILQHSKVTNQESKLSDIYDFLTHEKILYGISQNRSAIIKSIIFTKKYNISIIEYIDTYLNFYSIRNSNCMKYMYHIYDNLRFQGYNSLQIATFIYPTYFSSLPKFLSSMSPDESVNFDLTISSLDINESDIYKNGIKKQLFFDKNLIMNYSNSDIFNSYKNEVYDKLEKFDKTRKLNHIINQKNSNYESF